ncbi:hypothetical protein [Alicyclobacillus ferrooxydans]|uniref:Uncharacterized protein n=1 Tax=Alicyclobacillus ferrooxydans TaxID=471514 RepID=A0A0P9D0G0_9BACL|nr:hypothetical protein [Alicyclobacillus ferrooxydans]KPV45510.1 hypothetical protein AN477_00705 [Alicyclobacillus ferrooxydans]
MAFRVKCELCGREQEWDDGKKYGEMYIEAVGSTIVCGCGHGIGDDGGTMREFKVPDVHDDPLDPRD